jgi:hypothetical protein
VKASYAHGERSDCAWLRRYCDNLDELLFHVPSELQIEWSPTALWLGMMPLPALKSQALGLQVQMDFGRTAERTLPKLTAGQVGRSTLVSW